MRRLFWVGVGAVGAVVVGQRLRQVAHRLSPDGVAEQAVDAGRRTGTAVRDAVAQFRTARAEREAELVTALLVDPEGGTVAERRAAREARPEATARPDAFDRRAPLDDDGEDDFF